VCIVDGVIGKKLVKMKLMEKLCACGLIRASKPAFGLMCFVVAALLGAGERAAAQSSSNNACTFVGPGPYTGTGSFPPTGTAHGDGLPTNDSMFSMGVFQIQVDTSNPTLPPLFNASGSLAAYPGWNPTTLTITSPILYDEPSGNPYPAYPGTLIGLSGAVALPISSFPFPVAIGLNPWPVSTITSMADYVSTYAHVPAPFSFAVTGTREILTEIQSFNLSLYPGEYANSGGPSGCGCSVPNMTPCFTYTGTSPLPMVLAGQYNTFVYTPLMPLSPSFGIVQSQQNGSAGYNTAVGNLGWDFPANSFFAVNVQVTLPQAGAAFSLSTASVNDFPTHGAILTNDPSMPLIVEEVPPNSTANEPICGLPPGVVYIHGGNAIAPKIYFVENNLPYWTAGEYLGSLTLAGHGATFSPCDPEAAVVGAILGTPNNSKPPMPIGYLVPTTAFPSPGTTYDSIYGVNLAGQTLDAATFDVDGTTVYIRNLSLDGFVNPIALPSTGASKTYTNTDTVVNYEISIDGTNYSSASGSGTAVIQISNTNGAASNPTYYPLQVLEMTLDTESEYGEIFLEQDTDTNSTGTHLVQSSSSAPASIASYINQYWELSTDNENFYAANRAMHLTLGNAPCGAAAPQIQIAASSSSLVLTWPIPSYTLQGTTSLAPTNWVAIAGSSPLTINLPTPYHFFRLVCN
jgi:hypothetical protein